jgi:hypothetical protein
MRWGGIGWAQGAGDVTIKGLGETFLTEYSQVIFILASYTLNAIKMMHMDK